MSVRCAVLDDYQGAAAGLADWASAGVELVVLRQHLDSEDAVVAAIGDCEIAVIMRERTPFTASLLGRLPKLRLLITSGMRNASIDLRAASAHGVTVCGTASASEPPVELTWALILGLTRHLTLEAGSVRRGGPWQRTVGTDLYGAQLGLLGLGKIGGKVAQVGLAFGMDVVAWSENLTDARSAEAGVTRAPSMNSLLETSDVLSIHLVLSDRTRGLLAAAELERMRRTAYLVNTSRSAIVDAEALVTALREGWIAGAGLDVFDTEPLPADDPLRTLPNVLATPHLGYVTERNYRTYFREAVEDITAFLAGKPVRQLA